MSIDSIFSSMDAGLLECLETAARACVEQHHDALSVEGLVKSIWETQEDMREAMLFAGLDLAGLPKGRGLSPNLRKGVATSCDFPVLAPSLIRLLMKSKQWANEEFPVLRLYPAALLYSLAVDPEFIQDAFLRAQFAQCAKTPFYRALLDKELSYQEHELMECPASSRDDVAVAQCPALSLYTSELTLQVQEGVVDPVTGREKETYQLIDIICRRRKNNPIVLGEAGVGKTALIEGLAWWINEKKAPPALWDTKIYSLDHAALTAGASIKGEFEKRVKAILEELEALGDKAILFIDEIHALLGGDDNGFQCADILKPALARGNVRVAGATTWREYKKYFEKDPAMVRRFQPLTVHPVTPQQARTILRTLVPALEAKHEVTIEDSALCNAVAWAEKYIPERMLPDKAIDLLDTASTRVYLSRSMPSLESCLIEAQIAAMQLEHSALSRPHEQTSSLRLGEVESDISKLQAVFSEQFSSVGQHQNLTAPADSVVEDNAGLNESLVAPSTVVQGLTTSVETNDTKNTNRRVVSADVAQVISDWTGVPVSAIQAKGDDRLSRLQKELGSRVLGQGDAHKELMHLLKVAQVGLRITEGPQAVFLFAGPSGVGKTETAALIAEHLCFGREKLVSINLSEYQESHSVARLIGAPPGYVGYGEGGLLTEAVRKRPYSVVLLDEVEKAHPDVLNLFFQVFDKGVLNDGEGRPTDFRQTIVVMTSNLGTETCIDASVTDQKYATLQALVTAELAQTLPSALLARTRVLPFRMLSEPHIQSIVENKLRTLADLVRRQGLLLEWDADLTGELMPFAFSASSGARKAAECVDRLILPVLADVLAEVRAEVPGQDNFGADQLQIIWDGEVQIVRASTVPDPSRQQDRQTCRQVVEVAC